MSLAALMTLGDQMNGKEADQGLYYTGEQNLPDVTGAGRTSDSVQNMSKAGAETAKAAEAGSSAAMFSNPKLLAASMALKVLADQQKRKQMDELNRYKAYENTRSNTQSALANMAGFHKTNRIV